MADQDAILENFRQTIERRAVVMEIGGFRPSDDPTASWFGRVLMSAAGEDWPMHNGEPMHALAQVNLTEFPLIPAGLEDIAFITVFIGPRELPIEQPNGSSWLIRTYRRVDALVPLDQQDSGSCIRPFPMRPELVTEDYPCLEDLVVDYPEGAETDYLNLFENVGGFKFGGWPSLIQSEVTWGNSDQETSPAYVFQIDSTEKGHWSWGHCGVGYFGRLPDTNNADAWALDWQSY